MEGLDFQEPGCLGDGSALLPSDAYLYESDEKVKDPLVKSTPLDPDIDFPDMGADSEGGVLESDIQDHFRQPDPATRDGHGELFDYGHFM
jgi:hypothetical protein